MTLKRRRTRLLEGSAQNKIGTGTRNSMEYPETAEFDELISSLKTGDFFAARRRSRFNGTASRRVEYSRERPISAVELNPPTEQSWSEMYRCFVNSSTPFHCQFILFIQYSILSWQLAKWRGRQMFFLWESKHELVRWNGSRTYYPGSLIYCSLTQLFHDAVYLGSALPNIMALFNSNVSCCALHSPFSGLNWPVQTSYCSSVLLLLFQHKVMLNFGQKPLLELLRSWVWVEVSYTEITASEMAQHSARTLVAVLSYHLNTHPATSQPLGQLAT